MSPYILSNPGTVYLKRKFCNIKNNYYLCIPHRGVEQLVARRAHNPEAGGSSPSPATKQAKNQSEDWFFCVYSCCLFWSLKAKSPSMHCNLHNCKSPRIAISALWGLYALKTRCQRWEVNNLLFRNVITSTKSHQRLERVVRAHLRGKPKCKKTV